MLCAEAHRAAEADDERLMPGTRVFDRLANRCLELYHHGRLFYHSPNFVLFHLISERSSDSLPSIRLDSSVPAQAAIFASTFASTYIHNGASQHIQF